MNIFPNLKKGKWIKLNLNEESRKSDLDLSVARNQITFVNFLLKSKEANYVYGGFLEDRTYIWRNRPNEAAPSLIHLGIDYTLPANTQVSLPMKGEVFHVMKDPRNKIGWGGRIIWELEDRTYLLCGHLKQDIELKIGQICKKGEIVGMTGDENENGNWWPHLHVQLMTQQFIDNYKDDFSQIDGYLPRCDADLVNLINPEKLISSQ